MSSSILCGPSLDSRVLGPALVYMLVQFMEGCGNWNCGHPSGPMSQILGGYHISSKCAGNIDNSFLFPPLYPVELRI